MKLLNTKSRIVFGLVGIITSLVMLAFFFGIVPDRVGAVREGRTSLAEAIAVHSTALVIKTDIQRLEGDFILLAERNADLLSLALHREDGRYLVTTGEHRINWQAMSGDYSTGSQMRVPIWNGDRKWGELELRFKPIIGSGLMGVLKDPMIQLILFMGLGCFIVFYLYLGRVLRHLDPSGAVPGRVRDALDTMAEGLLVLDRKEQIVLANQAFAAMLGKSPDDLLGTRAGDLSWMDTEGNRIEKQIRPWVLALAQGETQRNRMLRLRLPDKEWRTFYVNCSPVLGSGGKYAGVLVSFDDITQLEEKEVELRKSMEQAEEANKAKSVFLANMSHEIRTPMTAILGFTEILMRGYVKNEKNSLRYLNTIHASGKNLLELINDILDISKVESGRLEVEKTWVEPYRIIHDVIRMLDVKAQEKGIALRFSAQGTLPKTIETDPARLRQIVFNLVGNAIKFTDQGSVTVNCRFEKASAGPRWLIEIMDTGIGMPQDRLETIFDPFVQADTTVTRRFGGTGLGLSISREFARAQGGDITAESEPGKGSTFSVTLPAGDMEGMLFLQPDDVAMQQQQISEVGAVNWQFPDARVLVVDDGAENRELVRLILEEAGLTVDEAENGLIGVEKAVAGQFDAILMDVQMPVMDGFTAVRKLRQQGLETPIIALTANAMKGFEQQCLEYGYTGYLTKPIDLDSFMKVMADLLKGKLVRNAPISSAVSSSMENVGEDAVSADSAPASEPASAEQRPVVSRLAANPKFHHLILSFTKKLKEQVVNMEDALKNGDLENLARLAHWLKGAGGTVGYNDFTEPAAELENFAKSGQAEQAGRMLERVKTLEKVIVAPIIDDSHKE